MMRGGGGHGAARGNICRHRGRVRVDTLVFLNCFFNLWVAVVDNFIGQESVF
jgi:hypothetical protein